jgi:trimeric autotransporter adhesin
MPQCRDLSSQQPQILPCTCVLAILLSIFSFSFRAGAQVTETSSQASATGAILPNLVRFNGRGADASGKPLSGLVGITFALYEQETGGPALWLETQNVQLDVNGHYSVLLGASNPSGLPNDVFSSGQARWVGVQVSGQAEQPRVMLLAVPYAMKAGDAATLGGLPSSAFMLAGSAAGGAPPTASPSSSLMTSATAPPPAASNVTTTGGTVNTIPLFTTASDIQNSILTQTAATAVNVAGKLNLPANGTATATAGKTSRPEAFGASAFNSNTKAAVPQTFQLQAEPAGNNTASPAANLSLLFGSGAVAPTETGLKINNKGVITFATGQTFPGTGNGTITGVKAGTGLTGGGTTGAVTLSLDTTKIPELGTANDFTAPQEFEANAGIGLAPSSNSYTPLSVGGTTSFGTWLALANTSTGGHTWNIISAGSGNAEGAGNLGITDLTGKSTIWLEGNTNTANLTATGTVGAAALVVTSTAGAAIIDADGFGKNAGGPTPGLRFGGGSSGEGIASNRTIGLTKYGLDFYTNYTARMSVLQNGQVAVGTASPGAQLGIVASSNAYPAIYAQGADGPAGSGQDGDAGMVAYGGNGDGDGEASSAITGIGGSGSIGGAGGYFIGGSSTSESIDGGDGIVAISSNPGADLSPFAGFFDGNVDIDGDLSKLSGSFKIDHPLDPANKYLRHSFVESPDMMNIYNGNVVTDANGDAIVPLPEWFETLNRDFRYQLTVVGQFAQAIVSGEVANHQFSIKTDKPGVKVSWQVTGIRQDPWANAHRIPVEVEKSARERGHYIRPELYGAPEEMSIAWARHPQMMKRIQQMRQNKATPRPSGIATASATSKP